MTDTTITEPAIVDRLERLADRIAGESRERDHGIAWAAGRPDLRVLLPSPDDDPQSDAVPPIEPDTILVWLLWEPSMAGSCVHRLFTLKLPSGRELLVDDFDVAPQSEVIGVIDRQDDCAHLRAFQAAISGEHTSEPLLTGFPDRITLAYGGVVLIDALAEALRRSSYAAESIAEPEYYWIAAVGEDAKQRLVAALEEELEEPAGDDRAEELAEMLERAEMTPSWLWAIDDDEAKRIQALASEEPPIALYAPPGIPASFDPITAGDDPLYRAAALLVAFGEL